MTSKNTTTSATCRANRSSTDACYSGWCERYVWISTGDRRSGRVGWVATDRVIAPYQVAKAGFVAVARERGRLIWGNRQRLKPVVTAQTAIMIEWGQLAWRDRAVRRL